ncbi:MAG TPA: DNA starvation/stationary phase protection protein Dps [Planctomycetota bacterium]|nr:DNA starvation/stationary phase protection protein Dps [Planctomycetota bacterium]
MHETKNDLPKSTRESVVRLLNQHLAAAIDLMTQSKQAHWNVKGPSFIALHELFDKVADAVEEQVDEIAERITALGGVAEGTIQVVGKRSKLHAYPLEIANGPDHVAALSTALAEFGKGARAAIDDADGLGDAGTADLFTQISREIDKQLWFVEAHAQGETAGGSARDGAAHASSARARR